MTELPQPDAPRAPLAGTIARAYRATWLTVCAALAAVGIAVLGIISAAALASLFAGFASVGGALAAAGGNSEGRPSGRSRSRRAVAGALTLGAAAPACLGLVAVLGADVLVLVVVLGAISPAAMRVYARWLLAAVRSPSPSMAHWAPGVAPVFPSFAPPQVPPGLHLLSTEDLCRAWCASHPILEERFSRRQLRATLATVRERQSYLDELERRDPAGLLAWLAAGPPAAGDPWPYLVGGRVKDQVIDWDELT